VDRLNASVAVSGITREWFEMKRPLEINKDNLGSLINLAPKTLEEKKQRLLQAIVRSCPNFETECVFNRGRDSLLLTCLQRENFYSCYDIFSLNNSVNGGRTKTSG
jgi:hypothetical protein